MSPTDASIREETRKKRITTLIVDMAEHRRVGILA